MEYVIVDCKGYFQSEEDSLFIIKEKPDWQKGRLNLPGGKIEQGETPVEAALREVQEETGYFNLSRTELMGILIDGESTIYCLRMTIDNWLRKEQEGTESYVWLPWHEVTNDPKLIPNLRIIVPLMRAGIKGFQIYDEYRSKQGTTHRVEVVIPDPEAT